MKPETEYPVNHRPVRVTVNGVPHCDVPMTRDFAQAYRAADDPPLPDDWQPTDLTVAWLLRAQVVARVAGLDAPHCTYRMKGKALEQVETAVSLGSGPGVTMYFRGFPVVVDESVPWCDFDVTHKDQP